MTVYEMILAIPEEIGYALVGFMAAFLLIMTAKLVKLIVEMIKERLEDEKNGTDY